jgi:amidase
VAGLRVATWFDDPVCPLDREYRRLLAGVADVLADAGAQVVDAHPPTELGSLVEDVFAMVGAAVAPSADFPQPGTHLSWLQAEERRAGSRRAWAEWFDGYDALLLPVLATPPFEHDHAPIGQRKILVDGAERNDIELIFWVGIISMLGLPSTAAPIGLTEGGLPVGIQVVAPMFHDRRTVRVADLLTQLVGGYQVPPGFE